VEVKPVKGFNIRLPSRVMKPEARHATASDFDNLLEVVIAVKGQMNRNKTRECMGAAEKLQAGCILRSSSPQLGASGASRRGDTNGYE
jgi:hypothetical protein